MMKRLICFLFGHRWYVPPNTGYALRCRRCQVNINNKPEEGEGKL